MAGSFLLFTLTPFEIPTHYYNLHTRLWEFMLGAILFMNIEKFAKTSPAILRLKLTNLAGLILAIILIFDNLPKTILLLLAALATSILIIYSDNKALFGRLLESRFVLTVGLMSYSIFLWHLPVINISRLYIEDYNLLHIGVLTFIIASLSYISYHFIEKYSTPAYIFSIKTFVVIKVIFITLILFSASMYAFSGQHKFKFGTNFYKDEALAAINYTKFDQLKFYLNGNYDCMLRKLRLCSVNAGESSNNILLAGDSLAFDFNKQFFSYSANKNLNATMISSPGCSFTKISGLHISKECLAGLKILEDTISNQQFDKIILVFSYNRSLLPGINTFDPEFLQTHLVSDPTKLKTFYSQWNSLIELASKHSNNVALVINRPLHSEPPALRYYNSDKSVQTLSSMDLKHFHLLRSKYSNLIIVDEFRTFYKYNLQKNNSNDSILLSPFRDKTHLTKQGSNFFFDEILSQFP